MTTSLRQTKEYKYVCEKCNFGSSKQSDYSRHLTTAKHLMTTGGLQKNSKTLWCDCGKSYSCRQNLYRHKTKCNYKQEQEQTSKVDTQKEDSKDNMIDLLLENQKEMLLEKKEMKDMFIMFLKNQMESQSTQMENQNNTNKMITGLHENQNNMTNKIITEVIKEVIPLIGNDHHNTTNSHNNTLNFYLTNTCKDAESITDFTSRFCERIETFFNGNYDKIAHNKISLAENVQNIFFECLDDKSQINRFIQTTDKKNGIFYVKEQKKNEENKMIGDAEFVKYKDGFDKHGAKIGHSIHKTLNPCKNACIPKLELNIQPKPNEDDYEDYDEYEKAYDNYRISTGEIKENLMFQTHYAMNLFDNKQVREKTLSETKRVKDA
jgi:hypothetical protein